MLFEKQRYDRRRDAAHAPIITSADRDSGTEDGFSLVELVVALGLMTLLVGFAAGAMMATRKAAPVLERAQRLEQLTAARDHLRRTLSEAVAGSAMRGSVRFEGDRTTLDFVAPADALLEAGGMLRIRLETEAEGRRMRLIERRSIERPLGGESPVRVVLLEDLVSFSLSYLDRNGVRVDSWSSALSPPRAIRVSLAIADAPPDAWIDLDVATNTMAE